MLYYNRYLCIFYIYDIVRLLYTYIVVVCYVFIFMISKKIYIYQNVSNGTATSWRESGADFGGPLIDLNM